MGGRGPAPWGRGGRGGRVRAAALVGGQCAVRFLGSASLRVVAVGRLGKPVRDPGQHHGTRDWDERWTAHRARRLQGTWLGGALGAVGTQAGGCAWPLWPAAGPVVVSSSRLRCARLLRGRSTRPWHVIDGLRLRAVGQRQCRPERGVVTTARPSAEHLQSIPARPACAGGGHWATERAPTESAACACGVRSIGRVDTTGCASSAGPTTAGVQLIRCVNRAFRNSGASTFHDVVKRTQTTGMPPHPPPP